LRKAWKQWYHTGTEAFSGNRIWQTPDSDTDAHRAFSPPLAELQNNDLRPYQTILSSSLQVPLCSATNMYRLDTANPAGTSPKVVNYLRSMGFAGLITTDRWVL